MTAPAVTHSDLPALAPSSRKRRRIVVAILVSAGLLVVAVTFSFIFGARAISLGTVVDALVGSHQNSVDQYSVDQYSVDRYSVDQVVVRDLRVPRTVIGVLAGLALGMAGTLMQGVTRNPLADPGLLGVNSGASLFVVVGISWFGVTTALGYVWFAFAGAAVAAVVVYAIGSLGREGATPVKLALAGTAFSAALTSLITIVLLSNAQAFDQFRFWQAGSLVARDLGSALTLTPFLAVGAVLAVFAARMLNALALGDDLARGLGQSVVLARVLSAAAVVLLCGSATAMAGPIVFVGLAVPHLARWLVGPDYRWILALSAFLGPVLLLTADVIGRLIAPPGEIEAGLVVAFLGAPVLIALVRRVKLAGL